MTAPVYQRSAPSLFRAAGCECAALLLGFGLGGFFDGILLHQVLQWHHLLSAVPRMQDLRTQLLADGLFHAAMYLVTAFGLWLLLRNRRELALGGTGRLVWAQLLIGFGTWHVTDALLSHWLLGIHRVRMDTSTPLVYDLVWLLGFGLVPLLIGWALLRVAHRRMQGAARGELSALLAALLVVGLSLATLLPALQSSSTVTVVLRPDVSTARFLSALDDARVLGSDARGKVWVLHLTSGSSPWALYRRGALYVSGTLLPAGCSAYLRN